jgi:hypothetical protein
VRLRKARTEQAKISGMSTIKSNALKRNEICTWSDEPVSSRAEMCVANPRTTTNRPVAAGSQRRLRRVFRKDSAELRETFVQTESEREKRNTCDDCPKEHKENESRDRDEDIHRFAIAIALREQSRLSGFDDIFNI